MDYQQALDFFKEEIKGGFCSPDCKDYQSVLVAIKAIEKQIPKKIKAAKEPIKADIQVLYWTTYECPICGGYIYRKRSVELLLLLWTII